MNLSIRNFLGSGVGKEIPQYTLNSVILGVTVCNFLLNLFDGNKLRLIDRVPFWELSSVQDCFVQGYILIDGFFN